MLITSLSPPKKIHNCVKDGQRSQNLRSIFGRIKAKTQSYQRKDGTHFQRFLDPSLDSSGWTSLGLDLMLDLTARMPFAEASEVANRWGVKVGHAELERLTAPIATALQMAVNTRLKRLSLKRLEQGSSRVITIQIDGVYVLEQPEAGFCAGIELKSILIAPNNAPRERTMLAGVYKPFELEELISGLLRVAGVRQSDRLIGVSDGAIWIEQLFASLGVEHVIDVYHGLEYAVEVMKCLGWSEEEQVTERKLWCHGKLNVHDWIKEFAPVARATGAGEDVLKAIEYLESRASRMAYQTLLKSGLQIGSGQSEGMNKRPCPKRPKPVRCIFRVKRRFRPKVHLGIKK